ncbi:TRAP transporter large permease [Truepera radiovictrix]|uniref:TRAP dicarboxylate transporter, DctM subunit n=1 Tax=Truepera radiovictrix (strain DSM 17093 / CIP 108686 / LMG 22925 / RQ-24) TaxID=649638 RepID=D7CQR5_TRURR|nr:TRAP transporter large permease subunit [Truepera radiovictrix]ADI15049.1 TRAP dicarboxylate transporter, DctM subunit [Truepera radiovictrix DSM 17093]WMT56398.1 TRAP transporter large permease subunit [Truepera radiovictrix]
MAYLSLWMFGAAILLLLIGYPVAFSLGGTAVLFTLIGSDLLPSWGVPLPWEPMFPLARLNILPNRIYGTIMDNYTLVAVPFFVFMGVMLEKSGLAEELLETMGTLFGSLRGGLAISVVAVGALLAASTGVVGASVVTMGVLALPVMLKYNYSKSLSTGVIASSGTLGQIIPPSIVLVILGDQIGVSVGQLFLGALIPGFLLAGLFILWVVFVAITRPQDAPAMPPEARTLRGGALALKVLKSLIPPLFLILLVLGTIFFGLATPTEAGAMGALGAMLLAAINRRLTLRNLLDTMSQTVTLTSMVFIILVGATAFSMVFTALRGDQVIDNFLLNLPGGQWGFLFFTMLVIFLLGFFIDFIEITFIVVPFIAPIALQYFGPEMMLWFGILVAMNLQSSFLTPPFGFALFYLKGVAPPSIKSGHIYQGIIPFIVLQLLMLVLLVLFPRLVTWLPSLARPTG